MISFFVPGLAQPAGSKRAFVLPNSIHQKPTGKWTGRSIVTDANPKSKDWKIQVRLLAKDFAPKEGLLSGPLKVSFVFQRQRPKGHWLPSGELNATGRRTPYPTTKPDALKLARAVEDSLTGLIYIDDAQIVDESLKKVWGVPGVWITIQEMNETQAVMARQQEALI